MSIDYKSTVIKSIGIAKTYKWLWVYGALLSYETGSQISKNFDFRGNNQQGEVQSVVGTQRAASETINSTLDTLTKWFSAVDTSTWLGIIAVSIFAIVIGTFVSMILWSWAKSSLIIGIEDGLKDISPDLPTTSVKGMTKIKPLIILSIISTGMILGLILLFCIVLGILAILFSIDETTGGIGLLLIGLPSLIAFIIAIVLFSLNPIYAERLVILKGILPWTAWKSGLLMVKKNFWPTVVMGLINSIASAIFTTVASIGAVIITGIPAFVMVAPNLAAQKIPSFPAWILLGIMFILLLAMLTVINSISNVFANANWNQLFSEATKISEVKKDKILKSKNEK